jgi:hypothetical protein
MIKRQVNRKWGHHVARGWVSLLNGRLRDFASSLEVDDEFPQPNARHFGPDFAAAHARWRHANVHQGPNHSTNGRRV